MRQVTNFNTCTLTIVKWFTVVLVIMLQWGEIISETPLLLQKVGWNSISLELLHIIWDIVQMLNN